MRHRHVQDFRKEIRPASEESQSILKEAKVLIEAKDIALRIAAVAKDKKSQKVVILDMRDISNLCDYFVILSCTSIRQVNAVAQAIIEDLERERIKPLSKVSPNDESGWQVLDFSSVVAHVFYKPMREFYSLERLWSDAKRLRAGRAKAG